jgi:hypothetical protein
MPLRHIFPIPCVEQCSVNDFCCSSEARKQAVIKDLALLEIKKTLKLYPA